MGKRTKQGMGGWIGALLRGINLLRLVIINVVFFGLLALLLVAFNRSPAPLAADTVLVLHPRGQLVEQYSGKALDRALGALSGRTRHEVRVRDLVAAIEHAQDDSHIRQILLLPGDLDGSGFAALREVGAALDRFRASGKPVLAWASHLDRNQYLLAAHADQVLLDPMGSVLITGLSSYRLFYADLLDKLGASVHLFRVGKYKSAAEPWVLDHASAAAKQADRAWMGDLWSQWLDQVAALRKLSAQTLHTTLTQWPARLATGPGDAAQLAQRSHLVDGLATRTELVARLRQAGVAAGRHGHGVREVGLRDYLARAGVQPTPGAAADVAIVVAAGEIVAGSQPGGRIGGRSTAALIRQAREDESIKALVLRVDSPGGSVYPAEIIRRQVALTRQAGKPVVVSMGNLAASGGYWISMNANAIYAEPDTITGSIGIFGMLYNVPGTLAKLGLHSDGVGVGPMAGAFDVTRPLDTDVATLVQTTIDQGYRRFVGKVAAARGLSVGQVQAVAQGRVWTGRQALQRGLVDHLGGLHAALAEAARLAKLGPGFSHGYLQPRSSALGRLAQGLRRGPVGRVLQAHGVYLPAWLAPVVRRAGPDLTLFRQAQAGRPAVYAYCFCAAR